MFLRKLIQKSEDCCLSDSRLRGNDTNSRRAGTLIEVLIASTILVVAIVAIAGTMLMAQKASRLSRDRLIATNLAVEGIEIVRNIRDTNWVRFSGDRGNCWMTVVGAPNCSNSYESIAADPGKNFYTVFVVSSLMWQLGAMSGNLNTSPATFQLKEETLAANKTILASGGAGTPTRFFRQIDINPDPILPGEKIEVISTVQWYDSGGTVQDVEIVERIYNW